MQSTREAVGTSVKRLLFGPATQDHASEKESARSPSPACLCERSLLARVADLHPYVLYGSAFVVLCSWPIWVVVALFAAPLLLPLIACRLALQVLRAADWNALRAIKLLMAVIQHCSGTLSVLPLVSTVIWYHTVRARADYVVKDVPFTYCPYPGARSTANTPQTSPSSTRSSTPLSGIAPQFPRSSSPGLSITGERCIADCLLDVYRHPPDAYVRPVIVFVYGGAWSTGSKMYYAKLAAILRRMSDAVVVVPDYPLYPTARMGHMIDCLYHVLRWVYGNITRYGGDPHRIHLVGHSAGAHLAMMLILRRALALSNDAPCPIPAACATRRQFRLPVGLLLPVPAPQSSKDIGCASTIDYRHCPAVASLSLFCGVFDLMNHFSFEYQRGVDRVSCMEAAAGGYWKAYSPVALLDSIAASQPSTPTHQRCGNGSHAISIMKGTPPSKSAGFDVAGADGASHSHTPPQLTEPSTHSRREDASILCLPVGRCMGFDPSHMPPTHLFHAAGDRVVPTTQSDAMRDALCKHGTPVAPVEHLHCGHSDVVLGPVSSELSNRGIHPVVVALSRVVHGA